ncbi:MAG: long-chain fatty acid--CoA ligase, partial [Deltaproteobacteria bacterium]|nr:long-chain fatty acid--CoA ligase [Deltaproteobacteria bacterium]
MASLQEEENMVNQQKIDSLPKLFFNQADRLRDRVALRHKNYGIWHRISWKEYGQKVKEVAAGLIASGLSKGEYVAILGDNRPEWLICHIAVMTAGGATCGIYPTSAPDQIFYVLNHSEAKILFVENEEQVDKVLQILPQLDLKEVVVWDPKGLWGFSHPQIIFFDQFLEKARAHLQGNPDCVKERMATIDPEDTAMIIYTSGTTGPPKGAMISHRNITLLTESFLEANPTYETDEVLSYLPLAHIYENLISLFQAVRSGGTVNFVEHIDTLGQNLREVSPTIFASVPRIWEKFASLIEIRMS